MLGGGTNQPIGTRTQNSLANPRTGGGIYFSFWTDMLTGFVISPRGGAVAWPALNSFVFITSRRFINNINSGYFGEVDEE